MLTTYPKTVRYKSNKSRPVRIIRDPSNETLDYYLPEAVARNLYTEGRLCLIECYSNHWDYAHTTPTSPIH